MQQSNAKGAVAIRRLIKFLRLQELKDANATNFGKILGLCVPPSDTGSCSVRSTSEENSLVFRYRFPDRLKYLEEDNILRHGPSLSTYTSILDEITTQALIAEAKRDPRPGASVSIQSQWGPAGGKAKALEEVDVVTTVTKQGRTLGFVRAEVRDPSDNALICYFDQVKYRPIWWVFGLVLSPFGLWLFNTPFGMWCADLVLRYVAPLLQKESKQTASENCEGILDSFEFTSDTTATFQYSAQHENPVGALHGGLQAILMERLGKKVAQQEFSKINGADCETECERLQISYQSSAKKAVELRAYLIEPPTADLPSTTLRIEIVRGSKNDGKPKKQVVVSEGILTFVKASSKKDQ